MMCVMLVGVLLHSLDHDIKELVPVGRFESTQTH